MMTRICCSYNFENSPCYLPVVLITTGYADFSPVVITITNPVQGQKDVDLSSADHGGSGPGALPGLGRGYDVQDRENSRNYLYSLYSLSFKGSKNGPPGKNLVIGSHIYIPVPQELSGDRPGCLHPDALKSCHQSSALIHPGMVQGILAIIAYPFGNRFQGTDCRREVHYGCGDCHAGNSVKVPGYTKSLVGESKDGAAVDDLVWIRRSPAIHEHPGKSGAGFNNFHTEQSGKFAGIEEGNHLMHFFLWTIMIGHGCSTD